MPWVSMKSSRSKLGQKLDISKFLSSFFVMWTNRVLKVLMNSYEYPLKQPCSDDN